MKIGRIVLMSMAVLILATALAGAGAPLRIPETELEPVTFADLDGWAEDDHAAAFAAFRASCRVIAKRMEAPASQLAAQRMDETLREICPRALGLGETVDSFKARRFLEENFRPVRISRLGEREGFITGYYEPEIEGRRSRGDGFLVPMYRRPAELVVKTAKPSKIRRISRSSSSTKAKTGKRKGYQLVSYYDRTAIENGVLKGRDLEICWVKDPVDAFFIHIQGSARIRLQDGKLLRLNYAASNGHPYLAIGRILAERGIVPLAEMTMDKIRTFIAESPEEEGRELMRMNRSYIFFREVAELPPEAEPIGAQGVPLTRDRSIAVDKAIHIYGTPFWIEAELPLERENTMTRFRRLVIAQDTGGAIVGPARADLYFGAGLDAGTVAGRMRHPGRFYLLVPLGADPARRGTAIPLPIPRPKS